MEVCNNRTPDSAKPKVFYGWVIVGGLFGVAFLGPMGRYILTSFFPFIMKDPGWSRETIGLAFTIHFWVYAFFALATGRFIDRIGGRTIIFTGGALMLIGLVCLSAVQQIWQFYLVFGVLLAAPVSMTHLVPNTAIVRKWFVKKAGLATGVVTIGTVLGLAALPPVINHYSASMGWRSICLICGIVIGVLIMLIAVLVIRNTPESMGLAPHGEESPANSDHTPKFRDDAVSPEISREQTPRQALRTRAFWYIFLAYSITGIPLQGILGHVIIWGVEAGVAPADSGLIMAMMTIPSIPVRVLAGWLGDRFGKKLVLIFFNACTILIWIWGWGYIKDSSSFFVFAVMIGFVYSAPFSLYTPFLGDIFGRSAVGTLMGAITLGHGLIGGIGPYLWGWIADAKGSYALNCVISAGCYGVVTILLCMIQPDSVRKSFKDKIDTSV
ncbi:MAG: MFS transporter [Pseudomonadota bacterium]